MHSMHACMHACMHAIPHGTPRSLMLARAHLNRGSAMAQLIPGGRVEPANWPSVTLRSQGGSQPQPLADSGVRNMQQHVKIKNQRLRDQKNLILTSQGAKTLKKLNFEISARKKVEKAWL